MAVISKLNLDEKDITKYDNEIISNINLDGVDYHFAELHGVASTSLGSSVEEPIIDMKISGNSEQKGKNLYNEMVFKEGYTVNRTGGAAANVNYRLSDYLELVPGLTYTSKSRSTYLPGSGTVIRCCCYDENKNFISMLFETDRFKLGVFTNTFTFPQNAKYLRHSYRITDTEIELYQKYPTAEQPIEIKSVGDKTKNLFDINSAELSKCEIDGNGIKFIAAGSFDIKLPAGKYTISFNRSANGNVVLRNGKVDNGYITMIETSSTSKTFTYNASVDGYLRISSFTAGLILSDIQIVEGDVVTEYEPYGYKVPIKISDGANEITKNIYLNEPLRKLGDDADYIDYKNKKIVRNIGKHIYNENDNWSIQDASYWFESGVTTAFYTQVPKDALQHANGLPCLCNLFKYDSTSDGINKKVPYISGNIVSLVINFYNTTVSTVEELKAYLAQTNLEIIYKLATPTEETIEIEEISTFDGTTEIEVDTAVMPSEFRVDYWKQIGLDNNYDEIIRSGSNILIIATSATITQTANNLEIGG